MFGFKWASISQKYKIKTFFKTTCLHFFNFYLPLGALVESNQEKPKSTTIILIDVDFVISQKLSSDIFVWLGKRGSEESFYIPNGMGVNSQQHFLQSDVIVLAYATRPW